MTKDLPSPLTLSAGGLRWRCWRGGSPGAPRLLLLHGTGSSARSWQGCWPHLQAWNWLAPDLPGHAGSGSLHAADQLAAMSAALGALLRELAWQPAVMAGHSAGAALGLRAWLDGQLPLLQRAVGLNAALLPLPGAARWLFPPAARLLLPLAPLAAQAAARPAALQRLVASTGSQLGPEALAHYRELLREPSHVTGVLRMMAGWDVRALLPALRQRCPPLLLAAGSRDMTVPAAQSRALASQLPDARFIELPGLGHLAHEEQPGLLARLLTEQT